MKKNTRKAASVLILLVLGAGIWWMSRNAVWLGDDLDYKYRMKGAIWESWGYINTIGQYFESQATHYLHVNGRIAAHALVQLFCGVLGQECFAVCNGVMYSLFALLLSRAGGIRLDNTGGMLTAICISILCFVTKMMPTCQIGYIWGMAVNLVWLSAFFREGRPSALKTAWLALSGIAVGNWQEALSVGVGAGLGSWWLSQFFRRDRHFHNFFDWRRSWMILGYLLGTLANVLSPANGGRMESIAVSPEHQLIICSYSLTALACLLLGMAYMIILHGRSTGFSFRFGCGIPSGALWIGIIVLVAFNAYIGIFSNRQLFGINMLASGLLLKMLPHHRLARWINVVLLAAVAGLWWVMGEGIRQVKRQYADIAILHKASADGSVEYDRVRVMTLGHPLDAKYYEDILGQFDNDLHHSMMKDFKHERRGKTLKLKPTAIPDREKTEQYAPGHFYATVGIPAEGTSKRRVRIYGHYTLGGIVNFPAEPFELEIEKYSRRRPPYATAVIIPEVPLFKADSIKLIKD